MFDFIKNEHEILKLWHDKDAFSKMRDKTKNAKETYRTLDGPITANGSMCIHHCWGRTLKDAMIKYNTLKGRRTHFQNGFDAQGMWVEVEMEKDLGLGGKKAITDYGLDKFTEKCIERVKYFAGMQTDQSIRLGQIMDWDKSYYTNSDHNIECIWNFLKICHERGMLKRSYKAMPWCPRCGTSLSEHEMNGSYKELTHKAVFVKVKIKNWYEDKRKQYGDASLLVWTTTPWTLSSNVAIAVNPKNRYVLVKLDGENLILGKDALRILKKRAEILEEFDGAYLDGLVYEPMLKLAVQDFEHKVVMWTDVSATDGSGTVHIAPGCGAEDFELGQRLGLKQIIPTDEAGVFTKDFEYLAGLNTNACEEIIFKKLEETGNLYYTHEHKHSYPYCWRCKTNVIFRLVEGWDIGTDTVRKQLLDSVKTVKWEPTFIQKTMEDWLVNMGDWNISRRRFYGLPLPIYPCDCGHITVVGSVAELKNLAVDKDAVDKIPHLHRPYIDTVEIKCPKCGRAVKRVADVGDCWLDAGIAPFSTAAKDYMPSEVVIEMKEQIRLWFYSQLFMSVVMKGKAPFEKVIGYGRILDENGGMFSKSGPNNIKFDDGIERFGADAVRYLFAGGNPAGDVRFGAGLIEEARRKMISMHNNFVFFETYYQIDKPAVAAHKPQNLCLMDEWLLEALNKYITECEASYENHKPHEVIEKTENLVENLSNFYIRINRRRFWKNQSDTDKLNAYWVLYRALKSICLVMSPITPFVCEHLWQTVIKAVEPGEADLVVAAEFPKVTEYNSKVKNLGGKVDLVQNIISLALSLRSRENLKLRQPLSALFVRTKDAETVKLFDSILRDEVNVKRVEIVQDDSKFNMQYLAVNFKTAGAVLKDKVQVLKSTLAALSDEEMAAAVAAFAKGKVSVGGFKNLNSDVFAVNFKSKPEYVSVTEGGLTLTLDTVITPDLQEEGILRELIRSIQVARQTADFDITARVVLCLNTKSEKIKNAIENNKAKICEEVLAVELVSVLTGGVKSAADIEGESVEIGIKLA